MALEADVQLHAVAVCWVAGVQVLPLTLMVVWHLAYVWVAVYSRRGCGVVCGCAGNGTVRCS